MKVGIVTEPLVDNYGGILQNYALQQALKRLGHEPLTLNYQPSLPFWRYLLYLAKNILLYPVKRKPIKRYHRFIERPDHISAFIGLNINATRPMASYRLPKGVEVLVVGSDQVWRREYNPEIEDMYLDFAKGSDVKRLAYAASVGVEKWNYTEAQTVSAKELIKSFDAVSVRESSAVALLKEHLDCEATLAPDPTLLLEASDYECLCSGVPKAEMPFIAVYLLDRTPEKEEFVKAKAVELGLEIHSASVSSKSECSIEQWVAMFRDAAYVITDSYHGSVFSTIFRKPFHLFVNVERGADRFRTLGDSLGLVYDGEVDPEGISAEKLESIRETGYGFLREHLK